MADRPWHKRYHGNAIAGYMGLSLEERGAYSTLLDYLYDRRAPLPDNMRLLAGYMDVSVRKAESVVDSLLRKGKLYRREDGTISNRRFEKEAENDARTSDLMAEIGSKGGRKSAESKKNNNEISGHSQRAVDGCSSYPEPQLELEPESKKKQNPSPKAPGKAVKSSIPDDFPHPAAKAAAVLHWQKKGRPDLAAAVEDQAAQFRDHHAARGGKMLDWDAAWRTWIRNALEFTRPPRSGPVPVTAPVPPDTAQWVARLEVFYNGHPETDEEQAIRAGYWRPDWGPEPGKAGCLVPAEAIEAYRRRRPPAAAVGRA